MAPIIVVPRNHIHGHPQGTQQVPEAFIFRDAAAIHTVPGDKHDVRGGWETVEVGNGALEVGRGGILAVGVSSHLRDMGVTDLGNDHCAPP
jgi:hypothetical protein